MTRKSEINRAISSLKAELFNIKLNEKASMIARIESMEKETKYRFLYGGELPSQYPCEDSEIEDSTPDHDFNHGEELFYGGDQRINRRCHVWNVRTPHAHSSVMVCKVIKVLLGDRWRIVGFVDKHNRRWDKAERYNK